MSLGRRSLSVSMINSPLSVVPFNGTLNFSSAFLPSDLVAIFTILFTAMATLIVNYLPRQLIFMRRRTVYYLWGEDWEEKALCLV